MYALRNEKVFALRNEKVFALRNEKVFALRNEKVFMPLPEKRTHSVSTNYNLGEGPTFGYKSS